MLKIETENIYVIGDSDKEPIRLLFDKEKEIFSHFIDLLKSYEDQKKVTIVYRGEKKESLKNKFKKEYGTRKFFNDLFIIGEKAKVYYQQKANKAIRSNDLTSISDVSDKVFRDIFDEYHKIFTQRQKFSASRTRKIDEFKEKHCVFVNYFKNSINSQSFCNTIIGQNDDENKIVIRDYYLYLLHTFCLGDKSFFVSTSTDINVARDFATKSRDKVNDDKSVIFFYFIPHPVNKYAVSCNKSKLGLGYELCSKLGLKTYNETVYQEQQEIAVKGTLFPHYIVCLFDIETKKYIVNHHLFNPDNSNNLEEKTLNGFYIFQEDFDDLIRKTNYTKSVTRQKRTGKYLDSYH
jgi:hypothetical protein